MENKDEKIVNQEEKIEIGKYIRYKPSTDKKLGRIKSYDGQQKVAWVVYECDEDWDNFMNYTSALTPYKDLFVIEDPKIKKKMKANKTYISLETNKLLKDCGIESEYVYLEHVVEDDIIFINKRSEYENGFGCNGYEKETLNSFPAFTWQEILWEYSEEFFGAERNGYDKLMRDVHCEKIIWYLRNKIYDEADLYFRENCILIKNGK